MRRAAIFGVVCLGLLVALAGVRSAIGGAERTDVLISLVLCSGMALACVLDARSLGKPMSGAAQLMLFFTWPVAVPVYLVWSRGWRRGTLRALLFVAALLVLGFGSYCVTGYALWGAAFFE